MIRKTVKAVLRSSLTQAANLPFTRRALHRAAVLARGEPIVFLRCRRVLPDKSRWTDHPDIGGRTTFTATEFETTLREMQKRIRFCHAGEALAALTAGERLDEGFAVLTFDESFSATAATALPILERLCVPALIFVSTGPLDDGSALWDSQLHAILNAHAPRPLSLGWIDAVLPTQTAEQRASAFRRILLSLVGVDEHILRERMSELMQRVDNTITAPKLDKMLTRDELHTLSQHELISVGAHGHTHAALDAVSSELRQRELRVPRQLLSELCGSAFLNIVSYPFGRGADGPNQVTEAAQSSGYQAGFTANNGICRPGDHLYTLPRLALSRRHGSIGAYELLGAHSAIDHFLHILAGTEDSLMADLEG